MATAMFIVREARSATVLLVRALRALGGMVAPYIPDRFSEAYGLNKPALDGLGRDGARLIVTVDCGIRSADEVAHAQARGLDVIVTDHHTVPRELPPALAVIDPKRPDCSYPFKELAGVGVAHRLVDALFRSVRSQCKGMAGSGQTDLDPDHYLDLVALGTVSDIVPLIGENRILVRRGLARMQAAPRLGLRALLEIAGVDGRKVDSQAIAFRLGPRVNAAGRLRSAMLAYELLATESSHEAERLSLLLNEINVERQQLLGHQVERARELLGDDEGRRILVIDDPDFHEGIVGLVASHHRFMHVQKMRPSKLKRFLRSARFEDHLELHRLDCLASHGDLGNFEFCRSALERFGPEDIRPVPLVTGHDLIRLGYLPGPAFKHALSAVEDAQLEGRVADRTGALALAREVLCRLAGAPGKPPGAGGLGQKADMVT